MLKRIISISFFFLVVLSGIKAGTQDSTGVVQKDGQTLIQYLVSPGETIYRISTNYGVSISTLLEMNPELENGLKVGQLINIPYNKPYIQERERMESSSANVTKHKVAPGETLYSLSKKYNVTIGELLKWNGMELKAGQEVIVSNPNPEIKDLAKETLPDPIEKPVVRKQEERKSEIVKVNEAPAEKVLPKKDLEELPVAKKEVVSNKTETPKATNVAAIDRKYDYNPNYKQVLVIPFDPHLYFSDADDEIAQSSRMPRTKVREVFRRRLNALLDPHGYETIHLMGGRFADTLADLNKIYSSVSYNYKEIIYSDYNDVDGHSSEEHREIRPDDEPQNKMTSFLNKQKSKVLNPHAEADKAKEDKFAGKFFGVSVKDPAFFQYFADKYSVDYYVFINQFEVVTDYENCLDRAAQNYERHFIAHYTIMDVEGNIIAGNKYKVYYDSNSNDINRIVADNVQKIAQRVINDLPSPGSGNY